MTVEDVTRVIEESCDVYTRFFAHNITIAPGDELKVRLRIRQSRDPNMVVCTNIGYEVIDLFDHVPRVRQMPLDDSAAAGKK